jgi:hypothetical protein
LGMNVDVLWRNIRSCPEKSSSNSNGWGKHGFITFTAPPYLKSKLEIPLCTLMSTNWNESRSSQSLWFQSIPSSCPVELCLWIGMIKLHTLNKRRSYIEAFFLLRVYLGSKFCNFFNLLVIHFLLDIPQNVLC